MLLSKAKKLNARRRCGRASAMTPTMSAGFVAAVVLNKKDTRLRRGWSNPHFVIIIDEG